MAKVSAALKHARKPGMGEGSRRIDLALQQCRKAARRQMQSYGMLDVQQGRVVNCN